MNESPLKRVARITAGQSPTSGDVVILSEAPDVRPFLQGNAEFGTVAPTARLGCAVAPKRAKAGDVLLSVRAPVGALNIADKDYGIGRGLVAVRPSEIHPRFLWWALHAAIPALRSAAVGSTYEAVTADHVGSLRIPAPPKDKQRRAADFLDAETARIDALIERKRTMIGLLDERWGSRVRNLVTRSRGPDFITLPLKRRWRVIDCKHRTPNYVTEGFAVVSPGDISRGRIDLSVCHRFVNGDDFSDLTEGRLPRRGDLIYSRNASIGIAAYVDTEEPFCMGQDVCLITSADQDQRFLMNVLNTLGLDQLDEAKIGSTFSRINVAQIAELRIPCPLPEVQRQIADDLAHERADLDRLVGKLDTQIQLLIEHCQALITAAVTGDLDLSEEAA